MTGSINIMLKRRLTDSMCSAWSARARRPGWFVLVQVRFRKRRVGKWDFWSVYGVPPGRPLFVLSTRGFSLATPAVYDGAKGPQPPQEWAAREPRPPPSDHRPGESDSSGAPIRGVCGVSLPAPSRVLFGAPVFCVSHLVVCRLRKAVSAPPAPSLPPGAPFPPSSRVTQLDWAGGHHVSCGAADYRADQLLPSCSAALARATGGTLCCWTSGSTASSCCPPTPSAPWARSASWRWTATRWPPFRRRRS